MESEMSLDQKLILWKKQILDPNNKASDENKLMAYGLIWALQNTFKKHKNRVVPITTDAIETDAIETAPITNGPQTTNTYDDALPG